MSHVFPPSLSNDCVLMFVDNALLPIVLGELRRLELRSSWNSDADHRLAYNAMAELRLNMACANDIVSGIDRLYMMLDNRLSGAIYTEVDGEAPILPMVPEAGASGTEPGLLSLVLAQGGMLPGGFLGIGSRPATYADIVSALRGGDGDDMESIIDKLDLLGDTSDIASIFGIVKDTTAEAAGLAIGGGTLATLLVASAGNSAALGAVVGSLVNVSDRLDVLISLLSPEEVTP